MPLPLPTPVGRRTALALLAAALPAIAAAMPSAMRQQVDAEIERLQAHADHAPAVDPTALERLPAPVHRYLAHTGADRAARAVLRHGSTQASMDCHFESSGALTRCESDDRLLRYSADVPERWIMTRTDYQVLGDLRLPTRMTAHWRLGESEFEQVRARIESVAFTPPVPQP